jgi:hypothetical protein
MEIKCVHTSLSKIHYMTDELVMIQVPNWQQFKSGTVTIGV